MQVTDSSAPYAPPTERGSVTYFTPGILFSLLAGGAQAVGLGAEASVMHYTRPRLPALGYGAFLQAQLNDGKWLRVGAGAQGVYGPFGIELGLGLRQGDNVDATTLSAHIGEFLSFGYVTIAIRESPAIVAFPGNLPSYGFETAGIIEIKLPLVVGGHDLTHAVPDLTRHD